MDTLNAFLFFAILGLTIGLSSFTGVLSAEDDKSSPGAAAKYCSIGGLGLGVLVFFLGAFDLDARFFLGYSVAVGSSAGVAFLSAQKVIRVGRKAAAVISGGLSSATSIAVLYSWPFG